MGPAIQFCPPGSLQSPHQIIPAKVLSHRLFRNESTRPLSGRQLKSSTFRPLFLYYVPNLKLKNRTWSLFNRYVFTSAVGGELALEEPTTEAGAEQASPKEQLVPEEASEGQESLPEDPSDSKQRKQRVPTRRTRKVVVREEDLVRGAIFTGKVTSIQPFGAFVDLGAFTNGLVHISRLSRSYVKAVEDVVKVGQEVTVQILEVNLDAGRIALRLQEENDEQLQNQGEGDQSSSGVGSKPGGGRQVRIAGRSGQPKRDTRKTATKLLKGQKLTGVVKNLVRSGVFVTLPAGDEGFLHASEVTSGAGNVVVHSYFQVGQEVNVRVLGIEKGRISLTMKQELDMQKLNLSINKNVIGGATNPFEIAFRQNAVIASYLEEKERLKKASEEKVVEANDPTELAAPVDNVLASGLSEEEESAPSIVSTDTKALSLDFQEDSAKVVDGGPQRVNVLGASEDKIQAAGLSAEEESALSIVSKRAKALSLDFQEDSANVVDEGPESVNVLAASEDNIQAAGLLAEEERARSIVSTEAKALSLDFQEDYAELVDEVPESVNVLAVSEENIQAAGLSEEEEGASSIVSTEAKGLSLNFQEDSAKVVDEGPESVNVLDDCVDSLLEKEGIATLPEIQSLPIDKAVIVSTESKALNLDHKEDSAVDEVPESVEVLDKSIASLVEKEGIATPPEFEPLPSEKAIEGTGGKEQEVVLESDELVNATVENQGLPSAVEGQTLTSEEASANVLEKGEEDDPLTLPTEKLEIYQNHNATTRSAIEEIAFEEDFSVVEKEPATNSADIRLLTTEETTNQELEQVQDVIPVVDVSADSLVEKQVPTAIVTRQEVEESQDDVPATELSFKSDSRNL